MDAISGLKERLGGEWIPAIYAEKVRSLRTRSLSIDVPGKENAAVIQHTLLGIEIKVGKHRFSCPDLASARYLLVFARLGCREFAIPYDITKISPIADELETAWHKLSLLITETSPEKARRLRTAAIKQMRTEIEAAGAGETMPEFTQTTKQRNR